jgi:plastocyanin
MHARRGSPERRLRDRRRRRAAALLAALALAAPAAAAAAPVTATAAPDPAAAPASAPAPAAPAAVAPEAAPAAEGRVVGERAVTAAPQPDGTATAAAASASATPVRAETPVAHAAATTGATISGFAFHPGAIAVHVGDTISWSNQDSATHTATANDGSFDTGEIAHGASGSHTFTTAGTFSYHCSIHPTMHGTVTVLAAAAAPSPSAAPAPSGSTTPPASGAAPPAAAAPSLPNTGVDAGGLALLGLGLLLAGLALRACTRPA